MYKIQLLIIKFDMCYNVKSLKINVKIWLIKKCISFYKCKKNTYKFFQLKTNKYDND